MEVGESGGDLSESGLENRGVSVKVEWFGHISVLEVLQPKPLEALYVSKPPEELQEISKPYSISASLLATSEQVSILTIGRLTRSL